MKKFTTKWGSILAGHIAAYHGINALGMDEEMLEMEYTRNGWDLPAKPVLEMPKVDKDFSVKKPGFAEGDDVDPELVELRLKARQAGIKGYALMKPETLKKKLAELN